MRRISQVIAILSCVILLTISTGAQEATALPTNWTTETPIAWMNAQVTAEAPVIALQTPADVETETADGDAYAIALDALVSVVLGIVNTAGGAVVIGLGIWKFAPIVLAIAEFLAKLTPRTDDDAAVARLRTELERAGVIQPAVTVKPIPDTSTTYTTNILPGSEG